MTTGFLEITAPFAPPPGTLRAEAVLSPCRYAGWREVAPAVLVLEGLNQFAVRLAMHGLARLDEARLLPAAVKALSMEGVLDREEMRVEGTAAPFGPTFRVSLTARRADAVGPVVRAEIVVARVAGAPPPSAPSGRATPWPGGPSPHPGGPPVLAPVPTRSPAEVCAFRVDPLAVLLAEHFPGFPVAPGSLVVGYVADALCMAGSGAPGWTGLRDVQFLRPVVPGQTFSCRLLAAPRQAPGDAAFEVVDEEGRAATRGVLVRASEHARPSAAAAPPAAAPGTTP